ncbi:DUF2147 domain-containing protein [uncultured Gammaproteobacteria bacterium]
MTKRGIPKLIPALALALMIAAAGAVRAETGPESPSPFGVWFTASGKAAIETFRCDAATLCGRIVWMADHTARLCGIEILHGFEPDGEGAWHKGTILDPRDGERWQAVISPEAGGVLHVRGFVLVPLLGQTQVWTRVPADFSERCRPATD